MKRNSASIASSARVPAAPSSTVSASRLSVPRTATTLLLRRISTFGRARELLHEVGAHAGLDLAASHEQRDGRGELGQVDRGLAGRVAAADDRDPLAATGERLGDRGAVEDADADERVDALDLELPVLDAGRDDQRLAGDLAPVVEVEDPVAILDAEAGRLPRVQELGAEPASPGRWRDVRGRRRRGPPGSPGSSRCATSSRPGRRAPRARRAACAGPPRRRTRPPRGPPARRPR